MKATIILGGLVGLALFALVGEPAALAAADAATHQAVIASDPAWMVLSGASLLAIASLLRRYVP